MFTVDTIFLSRTHKSRHQQPKKNPRYSQAQPTTPNDIHMPVRGQNRGGIQHPNMASTQIQHANIQFPAPSRTHNPRPLPQNQTLTYETPKARQRLHDGGVNYGARHVDDDIRVKGKKASRKTHWSVGTIPEGCLARSTGWVPSSTC